MLNQKQFINVFGKPDEGFAARFDAALEAARADTEDTFGEPWAFTPAEEQAAPKKREWPRRLGIATAACMLLVMAGTALLYAGGYIGAPEETPWAIPGAGGTEDEVEKCPMPDGECWHNWVGQGGSYSVSNPEDGTTDYYYRYIECSECNAINTSPPPYMTTE
ncbi:MAG: hypothetical protein FWG72_03170 [Oscillospiraceae bacterium]|nr:hypothetical protein [Oscillospiraceae bacterium]